MDALTLARWQFGVTTVYDFFFVPLTLGLVWVVAALHTAWYVTGQDVWKRLTKFWGKLFLINFAMGVATGIVQEFQFGMNWSEYSRFVGDVFGAPLAIEALLAFFLESTFLGLWIFGWDKLPKKAHLASIWLGAVGSNISALWILIANSFMQQPMGYALRNGRAEMESFFALITNPHVFVQFPHVIAGAMATAAFCVLGISAWHLLRAKDEETKDAFRHSFHFGALYAFVATVAVMVVGHTWAFTMTTLTILFTVATLFVSLYPRVMVSSLNPEWSLTIYSASSTPYTLKIMTVVAGIFVPIVLAYQAWTYWVFRHRITAESKLEY
jgi:cytochrome d ubiquinol oxidase subunit I